MMRSSVVIPWAVAGLLAGALPGFGKDPRGTAEPVRGYTESAAAAATCVTLSDSLGPGVSRKTKEKAVAKLGALVQSASVQDRISAGFINGEFGHALDPVVVRKNIRTLISDPHPEVRLSALETCGFGCTANIADVVLPELPSIKMLFNDPDPEVRSTARAAARKLGNFRAAR